MSSIYTPIEYANMHYIYGECRGNATQPAKLYRERYPNNRHPGRGLFTRVHIAYCEGRIPGTGIGGIKEGRPPVYDPDEVLELVEEDLLMSVRALSRRTGIPKSTLQRILQKHKQS